MIHTVHYLKCDWCGAKDKIDTDGYRIEPEKLRLTGWRYDWVGADCMALCPRCARNRAKETSVEAPASEWVIRFDAKDRRKKAPRGRHPSAKARIRGTWEYLEIESQEWDDSDPKHHYLTVRLRKSVRRDMVIIDLESDCYGSSGETVEVRT